MQPGRPIALDAQDHTTSGSDESSRLSSREHVATLLGIPSEIFLHIISYLSAADVLAVRQTCIRANHLTRDRLLWLDLLHTTNGQLPLPSAVARDPNATARDLSSTEIERLVLSYHCVERTWLRRRVSSVTLEPRPKGSVDLEFDSHTDGSRTILALDVFLDRFLLCVYHERLIEVWDLLPNNVLHTLGKSANATESRPLLCASKPVLGTGLFTSCCACLDGSQRVVHVAVTSHDGSTFLRVGMPHEKDLGTVPQINIRISPALQLPNLTMLVRAICPTSKFAFLSYSNVCTLASQELQVLYKLDIPERDEDEVQWNGVIAARFITEYHILCVRTRSVELYTLPTNYKVNGSSAPPAEVVRLPAQAVTHDFPRTTFRGASVSEPQRSLNPSQRLHSSESPSEADIIRTTVSFLAYDVLRGLFHYRVSLLLPVPTPGGGIFQDPPPPHMTVHLLAARHMALPYNPSTVNIGSGVRVPRSGLTPGSRGFVSACTLGPRGMRGIWVERRRGSVQRGVLGFKSSPDVALSFGGRPSEQDETVSDTQASTSENEGTGEGTEEELNWWEDPGERTLRGETIYEVFSPDLRDDITHCAFSEATGRVILGTRHGELQLL
ncbi:hypothetical protein POSPLADRAFT_1069597 [Postia placenta MAD-698-R-SB12]|uniref:F-box domain-containing protein n=1 Tax=Postia placenta MAD-698-R-SB12 TaxID=670580 RepID=A0A1X6N690_9APHY|nr:hypothetical protein POSPLADRAFT_1069597 [Postia placenta MAD-698-R-SB12]OSX64117.1 hypothetical protein POSPLADRAFT_1069597 [Postia placenta MAD-698-R-SB12]